jgi:hypothetical protein
VMAVFGAEPEMGIETTAGDWSEISTAPRDGTPVILWLDRDDAPPDFPLTVGFWTSSPQAGVSYWKLFGEPPRFCSDRQIRGWRPLLRS